VVREYHGTNAQGEPVVKKLVLMAHIPIASSRGLLLHMLGFPVTDEVSLYQDAARSEQLSHDLAFDALVTAPVYFTVHTGVTAALTTPLATRTNVTPRASHVQGRAARPRRPLTYPWCPSPNGCLRGRSRRR
jgi:hypothetical protein